MSSLLRQEFFLGLFKELFERFPLGVFMSKNAPSDLTSIDYDKDFTYFYFSPGFENRCDIKRFQMLDGRTTAKRDFVLDFKEYFDADIDVMKNYRSGEVLNLCEHWAPPGIDTYVYTRKTAIELCESHYMLCYFEYCDEVTLGLAKFKKVPHNALSTLPSCGEFSRSPSKLKVYFTT